MSDAPDPNATRAEEGTEWFWRIVDANGLGNVPSDEIPALRLLCDRAERTQTAEAHLAEATATIERLTRERDEALCLAEGPSTLKELAAACIEHTFARGEAEATASALRGRVAGLEEALRPFAEEADSLEEGDRGHLWESPQAMNLTTQNLRAARAALSARPEAQETDNG